MINYKIIDDFLTQDDFSALSNLKLDDIPENEIKIYHNEIDKNHSVVSNTIDKNLIERLNKNYLNKGLEILKELNPEKCSLLDYSDFTIIKTGKNYKFPIHDDTPNKLLSGVIYLTPKKNTGTIIYETKSGKGKKTIDWQQNRGLFFSRIENETWHSYEGDGVSDRVALVFNLMTKNIKKVYEIEKKSYYLGNLRWKLNPYLYRYFKINI